MKTRFDDKFWITGCGEVMQVKDMETEHMMNCVKMFVQKPERTIAMLIVDIEKHSDFYPVQPWNGSNAVENVVKESINNITSMTKAELIDYAMNSTLGKAMVEELCNRGVNVENYLTFINERN